MFPAHQCFKARNGAIIKPDNRLIDQTDFIALKGTAQIGFQLQFVTADCTERRAERLNAVTAKAFGLMHGQFRVFDKIFRRGCGFRPGNQADRCR